MKNNKDKMYNKRRELIMYNERVLVEKTIDGTNFELSESSDALGDSIFCIKKEIWDGAWETIAITRSMEDAFSAFSDDKWMNSKMSFNF